VTGEVFTAKDFRTWSGTVLACAAFREICSSAPRGSDASAQGKTSKPTKAALNRNVLQAIDAVAGVLGNTRAVCRKSYVHPAIVESYLDGTLQSACQRYWAVRSRRARNGLSADEAAVVALLRRRSQESRKKAA
jgi:DNA topoisomerase I